MTDFDPITLEAMPERRVLRVTLLRHGAVEEQDVRRVRGQRDVKLSTVGLDQTRRLARWLRDQGDVPEAVYSSDLVRCKTLAEQLHAGGSVTVCYDRDLREQSLGSWEGRPWAELNEEDPQGVADYWEHYAEHRPPEGESMVELSQRAARWWTARLAGDEQHIIVVTHAGFIRATLCHFLGVPLGECLRIAPAMGSRTELLLAAAGAVLTKLGETPPSPSTNAPLGRLLGPARIQPRIALSGSAGTGKTTLGQSLAESLGVPYIGEGMRERLAAGLDLHSLDSTGLGALIEELWEEQREREERATEGFVSDRSPLDYAAFWLHYAIYQGSPHTEDFLARMTEESGRYGRIVLLPWGVLPLEEDQVRSTNPWLQLRFQSILEGLHARRADAARLLRLPPIDSLSARLAFCRDHL